MLPCEVCGGTDFIRATYSTEGTVAPAFECTRCHALVLDEAAAETDDERESVRKAKAVRDQICARSLADEASTRWSPVLPVTLVATGRRASRPKHDR
jgi:hypothetical protein